MVIRACLYNQEQIAKRLRNRRSVPATIAVTVSDAPADEPDANSEAAHEKSLEQLLAECHIDQTPCLVHSLPALIKPSQGRLRKSIKLDQPRQQDAPTSNTISSGVASQFNRSPCRTNVPAKAVTRSAPVKSSSTKSPAPRSAIKSSTATTSTKVVKSQSHSHNKTPATDEVAPRRFTLPEIEEKLRRRHRSEEDAQRMRQSDPRVYGHKQPVRRLHLTQKPPVPTSTLDNSGLLDKAREQFESDQRRAEQLLRRVLSENHIITSAPDGRAASQCNKRATSRQSKASTQLSSHLIIAPLESVVSGEAHSKEDSNESYSDDDFDRDADTYADDLFPPADGHDIDSMAVKAAAINTSHDGMALINNTSESSLTSEASMSESASVTDSHIEFPILRESLLTEADLPRLPSDTRFDDFFATNENNIQLGTKSEYGAASEIGLGLGQESFSFHSDMDGYMPGAPVPVHLLPPSHSTDGKEDTVVDDNTTSEGKGTSDPLIRSCVKSANVPLVKESHSNTDDLAESEYDNEDFENPCSSGRRTSASESHRDGVKEIHNASKEQLSRKQSSSPSSTGLFPAISARRPSSSALRSTKSTARSTGQLHNKGSGSRSRSALITPEDGKEQKRTERHTSGSIALDADSSGDLDDSTALCVPLVPLHRANSLLEDFSVSCSSPSSSSVPLALSSGAGIAVNSSSKINNKEPTDQNKLNHSTITPSVVTTSTSQATGSYLPSVHKSGAESSARRKGLLRRPPQPAAI